MLAVRSVSKTRERSLHDCAECDEPISRIQYSLANHFSRRQGSQDKKNKGAGGPPRHSSPKKVSDFVLETIARGPQIIPNAIVHCLVVLHALAGKRGCENRLVPVNYCQNRG